MNLTQYNIESALMLLVILITGLIIVIPQFKIPTSSFQNYIDIIFVVGGITFFFILISLSLTAP